MLLDLQDWATSRHWPVAIVTADTYYANTAFPAFFAQATAEAPLRFCLPDGVHALQAPPPDLPLFIRSLCFRIDHHKQHWQVMSGTGCHLVSLTGMSDGTVLVEIAPFEYPVQADIESEKMKLAVQVSDLGIWDVDSQKGMIYLDTRAKNILGVPHARAYVSEIEWFGNVHPDDLQELTRNVQRHESGDTAKIITEHRFRHGDGHWVWLSTHGKVIERDGQGHPLRIIGTMRDITARKQAAEQSNTLLRQIEAVIRTSLAAGDPPGVPPIPDGSRQLTARQQEVAMLVAQGLSSKDIAKRLTVSVGTVLVHRRELMKTLGLKNTAEVTRYVLSQGWL